MLHGVLCLSLYKVTSIIFLHICTHILKYSIFYISLGAIEYSAVDILTPGSQAVCRLGWPIPEFFSLEPRVTG